MIAEGHVVNIYNIDKLGELGIQLPDRGVGTGDDNSDSRHGRIIRRRHVEGVDVIAARRKHTGHARECAHFVLQKH